MPPHQDWADTPDDKLIERQQQQELLMQNPPPAKAKEVKKVAPLARLHCCRLRSLHSFTLSLWLIC